MIYITTEKEILKYKDFFKKIKIYNHWENYKNSDITFIGWGRKKSGKTAIKLAKKYNKKYLLLEDGFIRSLGLGNTKSFSIIGDETGVYYDATEESDLEIFNLQTSKNKKNIKMIEETRKIINELLKNKISKYNNSIKLPENYFENKENILIIAQTHGDMSLKYGLAEEFNTMKIIEDAIKENPNSNIYIKIHPDVVAGLKNSDIEIKNIPKNVKIVTENYNPIEFLSNFKKVYTKTSQMGFEAILCGAECICYGAPFYSNWGITKDKITLLRREKRRRDLEVEEIFYNAYIKYTKYFNYFNNKKSNIMEIIDTISIQKKEERKNKLFLYGFSLWKQEYIKPFLKEYKKENIIFINEKENLLINSIKKGFNKNCEIMIWGKKEFPEIEQFANENNINIGRIEDGFIRSIGLGSDLTQPYSLVIDKKGIYFDPNSESDLENIINNKDNFNNERLINYAIKLKNIIIKNKISKYNNHTKKFNKEKLNTEKKVILVIGQVEDDASIKYGGNNMKNIELLQQVKKENSNDFIIYKPHPDVTSGNRVGNIESEIVLKYANIELRDISISELLDVCDEIHTISSLTGFEGLLRNKKVVCYGIPFYSNWGLTIDKKIKINRRKDVNINELILATYYLYPRYLNPETNEYCNPELLISYIKSNMLNKNKFQIKIRNFIIRKLQKIYKKVKK